MKSLLSFFIFSIAFSTNAFAQMNGSWAGELRFVSSGGDDSQLVCTITVSSTETSVEINDVDGCLYTPSDLTHYDRNGLELSFNGNPPSGRVVSDSELAFDTGGWQLTLRVLEDGSLEIAEKYREVDGYTDTTTGQLQAGASSPSVRSTNRIFRTKKFHRLMAK